MSKVADISQHSDSKVGWARKRFGKAWYSPRKFGTLSIRLSALHFSNRLDCCVHEVQPDVCVVSFWLNKPKALGPGASLYCHDLEVLRFDCFGAELGHFHLTPLSMWQATEKRIRFPELTVQAQIDRTAFELTHNVDYYMQLNPRPRVRKLKIDKDRMIAACREASEKMRSHLMTKPELQSLRSTQ